MILTDLIKTSLYAKCRIENFYLNALSPSLWFPSPPSFPKFSKCLKYLTAGMAKPSDDLIGLNSIPLDAKVKVEEYRLIQVLI